MSRVAWRGPTRARPAVSERAKLYLAPGAAPRTKAVVLSSAMTKRHYSRHPCAAVGLGLLLLSTACRSSSPPPQLAGSATPVYSQVTGRLEALQSDTNGDGKIDTLAHMDGVTLKHIEVDRDFDGRFDRWEYYVSAPGSPGALRSPDGKSVIEHAEESDGPDGRITRREFYKDGTIARVEEDSDTDGRIDKWELYVSGVLRQMDLDLENRGRPTRRLVYGPYGDVLRVEADPDGDGAFELVASPAGQGSGG